MVNIIFREKKWKKKKNEGNGIKQSQKMDREDERVRGWGENVARENDNRVL